MLMAAAQSLYDLAWDQIAVGTAAVVATIYLARVFRKINQDVLTFFGNHLSKVTKSLEDVAVNLAALNGKVDQLHDDNVNTANALRGADTRREKKGKKNK